MQIRLHGIIPIGFKGKPGNHCDYALLQHNQHLKVKQTAQKSVHILFRTYILSTIYIHVQSMENKMSADERGNQTQLLFHLWGTLLRDPL